MPTNEQTIVPEMLPTNGPDYPPKGPDVNPGANVAEGGVLVGVQLVAGVLNFSFADVADSNGNQDDFVGFDPKKRRKMIKIKKNSRIELILNGNTHWYFDPGIEPIRFADENAANSYYKVSRVNGTNQRLLIEATKRTGVPSQHSFNIYLMLQQNLGDDLAIRIDPDMDNPPL